MSTISDALKKAQNQRAEGHPSVPVPTHVERRPIGDNLGPASRITSHVLIVLVAAVCLLLGVQLWRSHRTGPPLVVRESVLKPAKVEPKAVERVAAPIVECPPQVVPVAAPVAEAVVAPVVEAMPQPAAERPPVPVLNGIFYSTRNPVAMINGESVKVGETVGGYRVVEILAERVRLEYGGEVVVVKLK